MARFIPKVGESTRLNRVPLERGLFIVTTDDRKIYADVVIDNVLQRIPLGGDFSMIGLDWSKVTDKPFEVVSNSDFSITEETIEGATVNKINVSDDLKFNNKNCLDKFSESPSGVLLYDNSDINKDRLVAKGRVNTVADLANIQNPAHGDVYLIGAAASTTFDLMVYLVVNEAGIWQPLYNQSVSYTNNVTDKPTINGVTVSGTLTSDDLHISAGGMTATTATLTAANWSGASAPYTQAITINGLKSTDYPIVDMNPSDTVATGITQEEQWSYITKAVATTDTLTFYCYSSKPTIDFNIVILK